MTSRSPHAEPVADPVEQAAHWFVVLASGDSGEEERARWQQWRAADPAHEQAWARIESIGDTFGAVPRQRAGAALTALTRRTPARRRSIASAVLAAVLGVAGWQGYRASDWSADAVAAIGEQRDLRLDDGSRLLLDTNTAVDIDFDGRSRLIRLRRGRVLVATGHDPTFAGQPFAVATAEGRVIALGTQFTVEQLRAETAVAVIEARVAVRREQVAEDVIVAQGRAVRFGRAGPIEPVALTDNDTAWSRGRLVADAMPLADFIAALGRYRAGELSCDPAVAGLRISGSFPLADTDRVLLALEETLPVRIERTPEGAVRFRRR